MTLYDSEKSVEKTEMHYNYTKDASVMQLCVKSLIINQELENLYLLNLMGGCAMKNVPLDEHCDLEVQ